MTIRSFARNFLLSIALVLVVPVSGYAAVVVVDGKAWRQVTETRNTPWTTLALSCNTDTGVCGGAYTGWTWASQAEVTSLFQFFIGTGFTGASFEQPSSTWAPAFLSAFSPTSSATDSSYDLVYGITRTLHPFLPESIPYAVSAYVANFSSSGADYADAQRRIPSPDSDSGSGAWMYKAAAPIPEPETYAMMLAGLGLLGFMSRKKKAEPA